jgi:hypothetical protein
LITSGGIINLDRTSKQQQRKINEKKRKNKEIIDLTELLNNQSKISKVNSD